MGRKYYLDPDTGQKVYIRPTVGKAQVKDVKVNGTSVVNTDKIANIDIRGKQDKTDYTLPTTSKTVVGAISELKQDIDDLSKGYSDTGLITDTIVLKTPTIKAGGSVSCYLTAISDITTLGGDHNYAGYKVYNAHTNELITSGYWWQIASAEAGTTSPANTYTTDVDFYVEYYVRYYTEGDEVTATYEIGTIKETVDSIVAAMENLSQGVGNLPQDVKINGTSILDENKVANIPVSSANCFGVVKANGSYGIQIDSDGILSTVQASTSLIDSRQGDKQCITPNNLDYAVKQTMCDDKGASWTDDEKLASRKRIGLGGNYELIAETTLEETTTQLIFGGLDEATKLNLKDCEVFICGPKQNMDRISEIYTEYFSVDKYAVVGSYASITPYETYFRKVSSRAYIDNGAVRSIFKNQSNSYVNVIEDVPKSGDSVSSTFESRAGLINGYINKIVVRRTSGIPEGIYIAVYGAKA